jgi:hypothetical protein
VPKELESPPAGDIPLRNIPDGLRARVRKALRTDADGNEVEVRDRRGRHKLTTVYLYAPNPDRDVRLSEPDTTFLLGAERRSWSTVIARSRDAERAFERAVTFALCGAIELECKTDGLALGEPVRWVLTPGWKARRGRQLTRRANARASWQERAELAAEAIGRRYPKFAQALRRERGPVARQVLVYAAEDLLAGRSYFGPRAFSQAHFRETKARDDASRILTKCEVEVEAQVELGTLRAGRTGLAGPITLETKTGQIDFAGIRGPTDVRLEQDRLRLVCRAETLIVIENRQAAEAVSDCYPDAALFWTQGLMGSESLRALAELARGAGRVIACTDADLGGVRIVEQVLGVAPDALVLDVGAWPHKARPPWRAGSISELGLEAALSGAARPLASACLARGYPVEQELSAVDALDAALARVE